MSDSDAATFEMTKGEARVVIAALAEAGTTAGGEGGQRLRDLQDYLAAEFEFDEYRSADRGGMAESDEGPFEGWFDDLVDGDGRETVQLSRVEADAVTDALADFELEKSHENAGVAETVRQRIVDAFDGSTA